MIPVILMICGGFWILSSFLIKTKDFKSTMFFNVIPFVSGMIVFGIALGMLGVINIPV